MREGVGPRYLVRVLQPGRTVDGVMAQLVVGVVQRVPFGSRRHLTPVQLRTRLLPPVRHGCAAAAPALKAPQATNACVATSGASGLEGDGAEEGQRRSTCSIYYYTYPW